MCQIRVDFTRITWFYLRNKIGATDAFKQFLADIRADGASSTVEVIRSDGGNEFNQDGKLGHLCREQGIKQDLTTAVSLQFSCMAGLTLGMLEAATMATQLQAKKCISMLNFR